MHRIMSHRFCPPDWQPSGRPVRCRMAWLLIVIAASLLVLTAPALAQTPEPPTPTPTPATSVTPQPPPPPELASNQIVLLAIATLIFAVVALLTILIYTYVAQRQFYAAAGKLGQAGQAVKAISVSSIERGGPEGGLRDLQQQVPLSIEGPGVVTVGVQSGEYKAMLPDGKPAAGASWTVAPASAASVNPIEAGSSARVKVIAATVGAFTLSAETTYEVTEKDPTTGNDRKTEKTATGSVGVAALAPEAKAVELPFIGQGYGAIAISVVLIAAVVVLGISNVLTGEGVATLLGGLLGYIFGVGVASNSNRKPANEG